MNDRSFVYSIKNMSWPTDHIFSKNDADLISDATAITELQANLLSTTGITKSEADKKGGGMWIKIDSDSSTTKKEEVLNYFDKLYAKLSCCLGGAEIDIPLLKNYVNSELQNLENSKFLNVVII